MVRVSSFKQYYDVLRETFRELEIIESVLKFLPSISLIEEISHMKVVINTFEIFFRFNGIDLLNHSEKTKFERKNAVRIAARKAKRNHAIPSYDVTSTAHKNQSRSVLFVSERYAATA